MFCLAKAASVFIFDKKALGQDKALDRKTKDKVIDLARRGATQLQKLRHPNVLRITFPVTESKDFIAFAAEPVTASLSNLLGKFDNLPKVSLAIKQYELDELECSIGVSQIADALAFCHENAELIHGNVTPDAVIITTDGSWKLWGFDFACHVRYQDPEMGVEFPEFSQTIPRSSSARAAQPDLDFLAPGSFLLSCCCFSCCCCCSSCCCFAVAVDLVPLLLLWHPSV